MKMEYEINGRKIECNLRQNDIRKLVANMNSISKESVTDGLVQYDKATDTVTVDDNASPSYAKYAAIHECICCGKYGHLAPKTEDAESRCGLIDVMLTKLMTTPEREAYIQKRIEMYNDLLRFNLNPSYNAQFKKSLKTLQSLE